jgi:GTPase Era involved in 16S rRNA processing
MNVDLTIKSSSKLREKDSSRLSSNAGDATDHEVHFLVCGGPKVGKSTLINALCASPVARVNNLLGLDQCTRTTTCYKMDNIYFWDTPGIQEWSQLEIDSYLNSSAIKQTPMCMFYCASRNSYANLKQLGRLLDECIRRRGIFCVLVVTNMFAHVNRPTGDTR